MPQLVARLWELADAESPMAAWSPRERDFADDLNNDMSYHGGFRLPEHWLPHDREYRVSSILFHRAHLKDGRLTSRLLPLLMLPESPYMPVVIPSSYWTPEMEQMMAEHAREKSVPEDPREQREHFYSQVLGPITSVIHETEMRQPHMDVYVFGPRDPYDHYLYLTGGLSDVDVTGEHRLEIAFYSSVRSLELGNFIRTLGHYPVDCGRTVGHGDTMTLGEVGEAALGTSRFPHLLFLAALRADDRRLGGMIEIDGDPVYPLMAVPITESEFTFIQEKGVSEFLAEVGKSPVSIIFDPERE
ncbi:MAG: suppressor of fused domain protein, partial [Verrucomicrobiaceae bacterium]